MRNRSHVMRIPVALTLAAAAVAVAASVHLAAQTRAAGAPAGDRTWTGRTLWGDPDLQGEWTSEGEYGVPLERPAQFGTRAFLSDEEYAKRIDDVRRRDARDLARVDVSSGNVRARMRRFRTGGNTTRRRAAPRSSSNRLTAVCRLAPR